MEWVKKIDKWINRGSIHGIPVDQVYEQLLRYHKELVELFDPQGNLIPPKLIMFWGFTSARALESRPDVLTTKEAEELAVFVNTYQLRGDAFFAPQYNTQFINRASLDSKLTLDVTLAEETGHRIVQIPDSRVNLSVDLFPTFNGPFEGFGERLVDNIKVRPPLHRIEREHWKDPYFLSMDEFFPPLFLTYLTGQEYPIEPEDFIYKRLTDSKIEHLPYLAGKMLVSQYKGDVKAILEDHPLITKVNGAQFWEKYCQPLLTSGKI